MKRAHAKLGKKKCDKSNGMVRHAGGEAFYRSKIRSQSFSKPVLLYCALHLYFSVGVFSLPFRKLEVSSMYSFKGLYLYSLGEGSWNRFILPLKLIMFFIYPCCILAVFLLVFVKHS